MGTTLYNKIPLGRTPLLHSLLDVLPGSRKARTALALGALAGAGIVWATMRTLK